MIVKLNLHQDICRDLCLQQVLAHDLTDDEVVDQIFGYLLEQLDNIVSLDFSGTALFMLQNQRAEYDNLFKIICNILTNSRKIQQINFTQSDLSLLTAENFEYLLGVLTRRQFTVVNLSSCNLSKLSENQLQQLLEVLSYSADDLQILNLNSNNLSELADNCLAMLIDFLDRCTCLKQLSVKHGNHLERLCPEQYFGLTNKAIATNQWLTSVSPVLSFSSKHSLSCGSIEEPVESFGLEATSISYRDYCSLGVPV